MWVWYDTGVTALVVDGRRVVGATWKQFADVGCRACARGGGRRRGLRDERRLWSRPTPPRLKALVARGMALGNSFRRRARHPRWGSPSAASPSTWRGRSSPRPSTRRVTPPRGSWSTGSAGASSRGRLSRADRGRPFEQPGAVGYLSWTRPRWPSRHTASAPGRRLGQRRGDGAGSRDARGLARATLGEYNEDAARGRTPVPQGAGLADPARPGPVGRLRPHAGQGLLRGLLARRAAGLGRRRGAPRGRHPVPGLYAAGAGAANIALDGTGYSSGTQLGEASYFGRRAGRHAAASAVE